MGDEAATRELSAYEETLRSNNVHRALEFESRLIYKAHSTFAFIPGVDATDLEHLRDDRHRAAHPTMRGLREPFRIAPEKALLHMHNAVDLMLSARSREGAGPVTDVERIVAAPGFPGSVAEARMWLHDSPLKDAGSSGIREVLEDQLVSVLRCEPGEAQQRAVAIGALSLMYPVEFESFMPEIVGTTVRGHRWNPGNLSALLHVVPAIWELLPDSARAAQVRYLSQRLEADGDNRLVFGYRVPELRRVVLARADDVTTAQLRWMASPNRRRTYTPLIVASLLARKWPKLLAEFLQKWPDLIESMSIQEAIAAAGVLQSVGLPMSPTLEPMPESGPKNFIDGVLRYGAGVLAAAHDVTNQESWRSVRIVSAELRARMERLMGEAIVDNETREQAQEAEQGLLRLEGSLEPVLSDREDDLD